LLIKKQFITLNGVPGYFYFFKSKKENDDNWSLDYIGLQPALQQELNVNYELKRENVSINRGKNIDDLIAEHVKSIEIHKRRRASEKTSSYSYYD
jgi:hypothetical protein